METAPTALERLIREGSEEDIRRFLLLLQPPEIADIIEALEGEEDRQRAFRAIVQPRRAEVLRGLEDPDRDDLLESMPPAEAAAVIQDLHTDDAADVLGEMGDAQKAAVLEHVPPEDREQLEQVLAHPEESAGGIMQTELVRVRESQTVREAVAEIRRTRHEVGELHEIFVVDDEDHLRGWVKERAMILAHDDDRIGNITTPVPKRVPVTMDQEEIAELVQDYDLSSVPVVDESDRLVGRILVDDIVDVVTEEATEDIARLAGTDPEEIYEPTIGQAVRSRAPWLFIAFIGSILASLIIHTGEDSIRRAGSLFAFIPVIMGMGGGSSTQAATVTVRSLALGRINLQQMSQIVAVLRKEVGVGLVFGACIGLGLWIVSRVVSGDPAVAWMAGGAVFGTICLGTLFGVLTPLILARMGADPAVATSPFVTTMNDLLGSTFILAATLIWV